MNLGGQNRTSQDASESNCDEKNQSQPVRRAVVQEPERSAVVVSTEVEPPEGVNGFWWASVCRAIAEAEYHATLAGNRYQAPNRAHGLRTYFGPEGIDVVERTIQERPSLFHLSLSEMGRGEHMTPVGSGVLSAEGGRVEIRRPQLVEWYENSVLGLEQGFTLEQRPDGEGLLILELELCSAEAVLRGESVLLTTECGRCLSYGSLFALDRGGDALPSHIEVPSTDRIRLVIDDSGAEYPLVIDPLITGTPDAVLESNVPWSGSFDSTLFGYSVSAAGDVNGDGFGDIVIGASGFDNGLFDEGAAFVFLGSSAGIVGTSPSTANAVLLGDNASGDFGNSVSGAGDVNGDGFADIIVGAHHYDSTLAGGTLAVDGAAFVFLGSSAGIVGSGPATAHATIFGDQVDCRLGHEVAGAGDLNGDGFGDVIIGAPLRGIPFPPNIPPNQGSGNGGAALVFLGSAAGITGTGFGDADSVILHYPPGQPVASGDQVGAGVCGAGDVNGDGFGDVLVGSGGGYALVFHGSAAGIVGTDPNTANSRINNSPSVSLSAIVSTAGDVNGDGFDDILLSDPGYPTGVTSGGHGAFMAFHGSASGITATSPADADTFIEGDLPIVILGPTQLLGWHLASIGDVDGDSFGDVIVGGLDFPGSLDNEGIGYVFRGSSTGLIGSTLGEAFVQLPTGQAGAAYRGNRPGYDIAGAGDVNGDGFPDVLIGAAHYDAGEAEEGAVFVYHGGTGGGPDTTPPVVNITAPADGSTVFGAVTISANATDNVAVAQVEFLVDGVVLATDSAAPYSTTWDTDLVAVGTHVLTARATDLSSNVGTSAPVTVTVAPPPDTTPPVVSITAPADGSTVSGIVTISANATDNVAVAQVEFLVDGVVLATDSVAPYSVTWDTDLVASGSHVLTARATDPSSNVGTSAPVTVTVGAPPDTTPPVVSITAPTNGSTVSGVVTISANATDNVAVTQVEFLVNGVSLATDSAAPYSAVWDTSLVADGTYVLTARASDPSGNVGTSAPISVSVVGVPSVLASDGFESGNFNGGTGSWLVSWSTTRARINTNGAHSGTRHARIRKSNGLMRRSCDLTGANSVHLTYWGRASKFEGNDQLLVMISVNGGPFTTVETLTGADSDNVYRFHDINLSGFPMSTNVRFEFRSNMNKGTFFLDDVEVVGITGPPPNQDPIAIAGPDVAVADSDATGSEVMTLNGSGSFDPDGTIASFEWREGAALLGTTAVLTQPFTVGIHNLTLTVTDNQGASATDAVVATVSANQPPVSNAGADQSASDSDGTGAELLTLNGTASADPDGTILGFAWSEAGLPLGTGAVLSHGFAVGSHTVTLTVTDNGGATAVDTTVVTVSPNKPPVSNAGADQSGADADGTGSEPVSLNGGASADPDGTIVGFAWSEGGVALGTGTVLNHNFTVGTHTVTLTVTDNGGATAADTVVVTISPNQPPVSAAGPDQTITDVDDNGTESVTLDGSGSSDPDGTLVSFAWSEAGLPLGTGAVLIQLFAVGTHTVTLTVTDNGGATSAASLTVTILPAPPPDTTPPVVSVTSPLEGAVVSGIVTITATATDDVAVTQVEFLVDGIVIATDAAAPYSAAWDVDQVAVGVYILTARATDSSNNVGTSAPVTVTKEGPPPDIDPPVVSITSPAEGATVNGVVTITATATDNVSVTQVEFLVDGVVLATDTAAPYSANWDSDQAALGAHVLTARATDPTGNVGVSPAVNVTASGPPPDIDPPVVSITSPAEGATLTGVLSINASATDNDSVTQVEFLVDGVIIATDTTAPYSASWDTATVADGAHVLTARAADPSGNVGTSAAVNVTVSGPPPPPVLGITLTGFPATASRGTQFTGSAIVTNTGGSDAAGLVANLSWTPGNTLKFEAGGANQNVPTVAAGGSQTVGWELKADKESPQVTITATLRDASGTVVAQDTTTMIIVK